MTALHPAGALTSIFDKSFDLAIANNETPNGIRYLGDKSNASGGLTGSVANCEDLEHDGALGGDRGR